MIVNIEHHINDEASKLVSECRNQFNCDIPKPLADWISEVDFYENYFLGPRNPKSSTKSQIRSAAERLDDFSVEIMLNKIHLEDQDISGPAVAVYFAVCNQMAQLMLSKKISGPLILWYNDDKKIADQEYPSQTMSFGFPRTENDYYYLEVDRFGNVAYIGTQISLVVG